MYYKSHMQIFFKALARTTLPDKENYTCPLKFVCAPPPPFPDFVLYITDFSLQDVITLGGHIKTWQVNQSQNSQSDWAFQYETRPTYFSDE